jgi:hypothetical protein
VLLAEFLHSFSCGGQAEPVISHEAGDGDVGLFLVKTEVEESLVGLAVAFVDWIAFQRTEYTRRDRGGELACESLSVS